MCDNSVFYYINGEPTNGLWIDINYIDCIDDVLEELAKNNIIARNVEEKPEYGGDLLVADVEGELASCFYEGYGCFDLDGFIDVRDSGVDAEVAAAFIKLFNCWDKCRCDEHYLGRFESDIDYTYHFVEEVGLLSSLPENLHFYFNYDKFAQDLMISDVCACNDHYFNKW